MDKKLIQQLLHDDETRAQISIAFGLAVDADDDHLYDGLMTNVLNKLNNTLVKGDMVTIEVSEGGMWVRGGTWVRGTYISTKKTGDVIVCRLGGIYAGKRVDLVVKDHEGEADV